jgi:hypothetical protein
MAAGNYDDDDDDDDAGCVLLLLAFAVLLPLHSSLGFY